MTASSYEDPTLTILRDLPREATFSVGRINPEQMHDLEEAEASLMITRWRLSSPEGKEESEQPETPPYPQYTTSQGLNTVSLASSPPRESAYRLRRLIGRGGCGEVWSAVQSSLGRVIAVKCLPDERFRQDQEGSSEQEHHLFSFKQEALTTGCLEHPNIVPVYDLGVDKNGRPLLAMKLVRGQPWNQMIKADFHTMQGVDFFAKHLPILIDVSQAVAFAHSRGFAHRDIKPSQVMVGQFGEVVLMDWGLAVVFDTEAGKDEDGDLVAPKFAPSIYVASSPAGTPAFMAPEQTFKTAEQVGPWTDIFLLGSTLYTLLTGTPPYQGPGATKAFEQAKQCKAQPPEERVSDRKIPPDLSHLCLKAMNPDYKQRPESVTEFIQGLEDYLSGASNRRESQHLTDEVKQLIQEVSRDYKKLSICDNQLIRALGLWRGNPEIASLREKVAEEYARAAIGNGDLKLARLQADRLEDEKVQKQLIEVIQTREAHLRRTHRQRFLFLIACAVSLPLLIIGFMLYQQEISIQMDIQRKREEDQEQASIAQERVRESRALMDQFYWLHDQYLEEARVAKIFSAMAPLPTTLYASAPTPHSQSDLRRISQTLLEIKQLRENRQKIEQEIKDVFTQIQPEDPILTIAEANYAFLKAQSPQDFLEVIELYQAAAATRPDLPHPWVGMGIAAARAEKPTDSKRYLTRAITLAHDFYAPTHPFSLWVERLKNSVSN